MKNLHAINSPLNNAFLFIAVILADCSSPSAKKIDRYALVHRHNVIMTKTDPLNVLTIGNGQFAFTAGVTGLQSFPEYYEHGIPVGTLSDWGWHSFPNPERYTLSDVFKKYKVGNDSVPYIFQFRNSKNERRDKASQWLRENPHRLNLGLIGLEMYDSNSHLISIENIKDPVQQLDLWKGEIKSDFKVNGIPVTVTTVCHQIQDLIAVHVSSALLTAKKINIKIQFPYPSHAQFGPAYDLSSKAIYYTETEDRSDHSVTFRNRMDSTVYFARLEWEGNARLHKTADHTFLLTPAGDKQEFTFSCRFSKEKVTGALPDFRETSANSAETWKKFWESGGAVDFSACTDPRAAELERRVVLSQYLTRAQCCGTLPPQETGLTCNSWYGKFHLEMHWWHSMHFILWNRAELMEPQMQYYFRIYNRALATARMQGYKGVRWPKMVGPDGRESPSTIGTFLIWQQPHIIYFSEMLYHYHHRDKAVLEKYKKLVFATADFMASYARWDSAKNKFVLGPALIPAQERFDPETTIDPAFELAYWYWGLKTAQRWRTRLGLQPDKHWQLVIDKLSDLPVKDSLYLFTETAPDSYTNPRYLTDHPMVLGALGFLPLTDKVNRKIMEKTMDKIIGVWNWKSLWGWDFPLMAMDATCLDRPQLAVDLLLKDTPKNTFLPDGNNYQDSTLTLYLPGNGSLLTAVAMMCTYRNKNGENGFPSDGKWNVKYENLLPWSDNNP